MRIVKLRISMLLLLAALIFTSCTGGGNTTTPAVPPANTDPAAESTAAGPQPTDALPVTGPEEAAVTATAITALTAIVETPPADREDAVDQRNPAGQGDPGVRSAPPDLPTPVATGVTLECTAPAEQTPQQTEGPYFTPNSPERTSLLEEGMGGVRLVLSGYVLTTDCQPVPGAKVDFWQADAQGNYDNQGYILRGHQFTDATGFYRLETVIPGEYPGRPPHIHVKIQAPNGPELTSQVYFPGGNNAADQIFNPDLVVQVLSSGVDGMQAAFHFVVEAP